MASILASQTSGSAYTIWVRGCQPEAVSALSMATREFRVCSVDSLDQLSTGEAALVPYGAIVDWSICKTHQFAFYHSFRRCWPHAPIAISISDDCDIETITEAIRLSMDGAIDVRVNAKDLGERMS